MVPAAWRAVSVLPFPFPPFLTFFIALQYLLDFSLVCKAPDDKATVSVLMDWRQATGTPSIGNTARPSSLGRVVMNANMENLDG